MIPKLAVLFIFASICIACVAGPSPERASKQLREGIYYQNKGAELFTKGCYQRAMAYFQDAHQIYTAADNQAGVVWALNSIADTYFRLDDMKSALLAYSEAVAISAYEKRSSDLARALTSEAAALVALSRLEEAASILDRVGEMPDKNGQEALYLKTRALLLMREKKPQQAEAFLKRALRAPGGDEDGIASSIHFSMGRLLMQTDQPERARRQFEEALALDRKEARHQDIAGDLEAIATTLAAVGDHTGATHFFKRSVKIYALLKDRRQVEAVLSSMEKSASLANIDIRATVHWVQTWLTDKSGSAICD